MKKEITIEDGKNVINIHIPDGYEIDKEKSTIECIKLKKCIRFRDDSTAIIDGFYFDNLTGKIIPGSHRNTPPNFDLYVTEKQLKSAITMARISQILENDKRFGGPVTDEEWNDNRIVKYVIVRDRNVIVPNISYTLYRFLAFHTTEQRNLFMEENMDLIKDYYML
jgi:hypothetical protein